MDKMLRIKTLDLTGSPISGTLPEELSRLPAITQLAFKGVSRASTAPARGEISGTVPEWLGKLSTLEIVQVRFRGAEGQSGRGEGRWWCVVYGPYGMVRVCAFDVVVVVCVYVRACVYVYARAQMCMWWVLMDTGGNPPQSLMTNPFTPPHILPPSLRPPVLQLFTTKLSGSLPSSLVNLTKLSFITLGDSPKLSGTLPSKGALNTGVWPKMFFFSILNVRAKQRC